MSRTSEINTSDIKPAQNYVGPIIIIGVLFFIFGFVTWLNGTLIPFLKISCQLNDFQAYLVTSAFYISYFVMSMPFSFVLKKTGFRKGIGLGLVIMAVGCLVFIPAALTRNYSIFLSGLFIQGAGLSLLQTAVNPYITLLGPVETAAKRISIMGVCNKLAGVASPIVLGAIVLKDASNIKEAISQATGAAKEALLNDLAGRVILPYIIMAIILVGLTLFVRLTNLPEVKANGDQDSEKGSKSSSDKKSIWQFPHLIFGFIALFLYVGVEVLAGDTIAIYGEYQNISLDIAKILTSFTLACMVIGYILGIIFMPKIISQTQALIISSVSGTIFGILAILTDGTTSVIFIGLLGLANALIYPAIWPLAIKGLGKFTEAGAALLVMGIAGGGIITPIYGALAEKMGDKQIAYWIIIPIYLFILFYALKGHKATKN
jgi:glucose/galactose transporter